MRGKNFSIETNIPSATKDKQPEVCNNSGGIGFSCKAFLWKVRDFGKEDVNRVLFSLKVGLAMLLVSLLILFKEPYEAFGIDNIIWSILTVALMFEYTVGATLNRGFNRALGSMLAGILAIAAAQLAHCTGQFAEPYIIGIFIFLIGTVTSFMKLWPSLVPYEYGFRVTLFTFCLIIVSGYRMGTPFSTAMDRLYSIGIGAFVAVAVNLFIFPIWAGEQLHKELVNSFNGVADSLEECVKKYLKDEGLKRPEFSKTVMDEFWDEPAYKKCRSTLNSSAKLQSLANSAKWEPPHGRFRHFFYPWSEYVKVGAVLRYCAYEVMALHGVLHSQIRAPYNLRITFQSEIQEVANQVAELLRVLGEDVNNMELSIKASLLKRVHNSTERLQRAIDLHSYLLASVNGTDPLENYSKPLSDLSIIALSSYTPYSYDLSSELSDHENNNLEKPASGTLVVLSRTESYHETLRKQSRKMHYSWPHRELAVLEEEGNLGSNVLPRMSALESTAKLSLATFTSLLIEFVARLDHLVEAVDELSIRAKFKKDEGF